MSGTSSRGCEEAVALTKCDSASYEHRWLHFEVSDWDVRLVGSEALTTQIIPGSSPKRVRGFFVMPYTQVRP